MQRRNIFAASAAAGAAALATPALSQGRIEWRMVTIWPRNLPGPGVAAQRCADRIGQLSGGRLTVRLFAAGEVVPAPGAFDAVAAGTADLYHGVPSFWISKSPGIGFFGSFPFGLTAYERQGWMMHGGGQPLYDQMYARFGIKPFIVGDSGPQWMGFFRREIRSADDFRGLRFRTAGLGGEMFRRAGASVVTLPAGEIFSALQSGTIDAAEFVGPFSDLPLGLHQVAKNYYYPGVQEPSSAEEIGINMARWNALPDDLKTVVRIAALSLHEETTTEYDTRHPIALQELVSRHGVTVREVPRELLQVFASTAADMMAEYRSHSDAQVKQIADSYATYRERSQAYMMQSYGAIFNARGAAIRRG
ncbi:TRAP transporter substrate-binding protein [Sabulicella glaciei]|uniref:TRAP transporter substrate-binding protein n=1 Tax=Sabulicella glaciei TaxID=2984948 RepID=A0ABT3NQC6_9PROT|nr:TRAP transporter substrate-binding protein [Roseococcus sp. MDT2-1-1]MCW8084360.1 TRAP transporter substrate-binding protein [Roseococcus sp. MDT2-1-1]